MKCGTLGTTIAEPVSHNARIRKRVVLRRGDIPHLTQVARACFPSGEIARAHAHADMWELFICEEGYGAIVVNNAVVNLAPGTWVLVEPGEVHEVSCSDRGNLVLSQVGVA